MPILPLTECLGSATHQQVLSADRLLRMPHGPHTTKRSATAAPAAQPPVPWLACQSPSPPWLTAQRTAMQLCERPASRFTSDDKAGSAVATSHGPHARMPCTEGCASPTHIGGAHLRGPIHPTRPGRKPPCHPHISVWQGSHKHAGRVMRPLSLANEAAAWRLPYTMRHALL